MNYILVLLTAEQMKDDDLHFHLKQIALMEAARIRTQDFKISIDQARREARIHFFRKQPRRRIAYNGVAAAIL